MVLCWGLSSISMSLLYWRVQTLTQHSRCSLTSDEVEGKDHLPQPPSNASPKATQDNISLLCDKAKLVAYV